MTKVIIIGAGIAGLSAGCYLQMNGYETEIFEMHNIAGGLCTSWRRKDYLIDGCIHWIVGGNPLDPCYEIWNGLVDMGNFSKGIYEEFCSIEENGTVLHQFGNLDKFEAELKKISSEDSKIIEEMIFGAKQIAAVSIPDKKDMDIKNEGQINENLRTMEEVFTKWNISIEEYSKKINSPLIRKLLTAFRSLDYTFSPMFGFLANAACFHNKNAFYLQGGSEELVNRIVKRYESLNGKIHCNSKVTKIIVEDGRANGIQLQNSQTISANYIISAADGHDTIFKMLEEKYIDDSVEKLYYNKKHIPKKSQIYISLGLARKFDESFKPYLFIKLENPLKILDQEITDIGITIHNFDSKAAPKGKTVLTMMIPVFDSDYWVKLRNKNKAEYDKKKDEIAKHIIEEIDAHFGDIKDKVEMIDIATPATFIRYTNNWNGVPMAWQDFVLSMNKPKKEIGGLNNFFMCGHWVGDLGLSGAAQSGRDIAQIFCKRDGKKFKSHI